MSLLLPKNLSGKPKGKQRGIENHTSPLETNQASVDELKTEEMLSVANLPDITTQAPESKGLPRANHQATILQPSGKCDSCHKPRLPIDTVMERDEYGAELAKEARVWKVYVKEADLWDTELVDGWNKTLDVILVFAALFSAVSTAFLIESSGMLTQDPNDVSAAALLAISKTLVLIANNSAADLTNIVAIENNAPPEFEPPLHAVIVNSLWFLSLSLSIAASLFAMLAKEWCRSFASNRTGHPWDQAHRRQRKWLMIERWKMQQLIIVLPSLIHLSLLLFTIGLSIYVWDLNSTTALPVICVSGIAFAFYIWSSFMASVVEFFPYTTIFSAIFRSEVMLPVYESARTVARAFVIGVLTSVQCVICVCLCVVLMALLLSFGTVYAPVLIVDIWCPGAVPWRHDAGLFFHILSVSVEFFKDKLMTHFIFTPLMDFLDHAITRVAASSLSMGNLDQGHVTSQALSWIIQNCETPSSVSIALQAIAGASTRIPSGPLVSCQASLQILRRIVSSSHDHTATSDNVLYTRALKFLGSKSLSQESETTNGDIEVSIRELQLEFESQAIDLIGGENFVPAPENLKALSIGNVATSLCLRLLRGDDQSGTEIFDSIVGLLKQHVESGGVQLHPASLQALFNASALLASCSPVSALCPELCRLCIVFCANIYIPISATQSGPQLASLAALTACALLHGGSKEQRKAQQSKTLLGTRTKRAVRLLLDSCSSGAGYQAKLAWVGLLDVICNPSWYDFESNWAIKLNCQSLEVWCHKQRIYYESRFPDTFQQKIDRRLIQLESVSLLAAITQVYGIVKLPRSGNMIVDILPEPVYGIVARIACWADSEDLTNQCGCLLSSFGFPRLTDRLVEILNHSLLSLLGHTFRSNNNPQARHFAATQLWLCFRLASRSRGAWKYYKLKQNIMGWMGHSPNEADERMKEMTEDLETYIILSYEGNQHLGIYSARVVECILEVGSHVDEGTLAERIKTDLKDVPAYLRGLSSFSLSAEGERRCQDKAVTIAIPSKEPSEHGVEITSTRTEMLGGSDYVVVDIRSESPDSEETESNLYLENLFY